MVLPVTQTTDCSSRLPPMSPNVPSSAKVAAYLRSRVRHEVEKQGLRPFAKAAKVSHPIIKDITSGKHRLSKAETVEKLAEYFDLKMPELHRAADRFALENPDLIEAEGFLQGAADSRVEYDEPRAPVLRSMPGYAEAEAEARRRYRNVPDEIWRLVGSSSGAAFRPPITPELLVDLATVMWKHASPAPED